MTYLFTGLFALFISCKAPRSVQKPATPDPVPPQSETVQTPPPVKPGNTRRIYDKQLNVALMMPFYFRQTEEPDAQMAQVSALCLDYYQGLRIAADSLKNMGIKLNLYVYDSEKDTFTTRRMLSRPEMKTMNLLIGPIFRDQISIVAAFCKANKIPMVSPFSSSSSSSGNSYIIRANADYQTWGEFLALHLTQNYRDASVLLIRDQKKIDKEFAPYFQQVLDSISDFRIRSTPFIKGPEQDYEEMLSEDKPNLVIISSVEETTVNAALALLKNSKKELHIFGLQSWLDFKTNYFSLWEQLHVNIISNYYVDLQAPATMQFRRTYRSQYFTEPSEYSYRGFDQMMFLGKNMLQFGPLFTESIVKKKETALHTEFNFSPAATGEIENKFLHVLQFRDYQLNKLDTQR